MICWDCNHILERHIIAANGIDGGCFDCYFGSKPQHLWQHRFKDNLTYIEELANLKSEK
jgi:hypothetical protein